jgi:hypothetical protein
MSKQSIAVVDLGRLDYPAALALQQQVSALRQQESIGDALLLVEHPPVLTLGRNARREHVVAGDELLGHKGISLFETNRGGDVTYHGPGQLVGYPILHLRRFTPPLGIVEYLRKLEEVLIRACADYGVLTQRHHRPQGFRAHRPLRDSRSWCNQYRSRSRHHAFPQPGGPFRMPALWPGFWPSDGMAGNAGGSAAVRAYRDFGIALK